MILYKCRLYVIFCFLLSFSTCLRPIDMYICTCADAEFFPKLLNFIGSVHKYNFKKLKEIAVFDLGFTADQIKKLNKIRKVAVYDIEITHPDLLKHFDVGRRDGRLVRGWYAWKPVAIKQALDMFPYVLYSDAGSVILKPLDNLFKHIKQNGYFFLRGSKNKLGLRTPEHVTKTFNLDSEERKYILNSVGLAAGFMGLTRKYYDNFVLPMYELSHNIDHFVDDGSSTLPARHDQILFSMYARLLGLEIKDSATHFLINNKKITAYIDRIVRFWDKQAYNWKKYIKYKR